MIVSQDVSRLFTACWLAGCGATVEESACVTRDSVRSGAREDGQIQVRRDCERAMVAMVSNGHTPLSFRDFQLEFVVPALGAQVQHAGVGHGCVLPSAFHLSLNTPEQIDALLPSLESYLRRHDYVVEIDLRLAVVTCTEH